MRKFWFSPQLSQRGSKNTQKKRYMKWIKWKRKSRCMRAKTDSCVCSFFVCLLFPHSLTIIIICHREVPYSCSITNSQDSCIMRPCLRAEQMLFSDFTEMTTNSRFLPLLLFFSKQTRIQWFWNFPQLCIWLCHEPIVLGRSYGPIFEACHGNLQGSWYTLLFEMTTCFQRTLI